MAEPRVVVVGGGIVGLATALEVQRRHPGAALTVFEKEPAWATHQTGRNSGVIHSGIYYRPGSQKARLCTAGAASMPAFCREHGLPVQITGKLIVASRPEELAQLDALLERGLANGVPVRRITAEEARGLEPHVACVGALRVESTGIVDYRAVCVRLADLLAAGGADLRLGEAVVGGLTTGRAIRVLTEAGGVEADVGVNCAGLHSDRVAESFGVQPPARIVPFRGEYFELRPERRHLVNGLIYPVPDPAFPFLGVHLTKMVDGSVHAGPNAVLALRREGYRWRQVSAGDLGQVLVSPGFRRLARQHWRRGLAEMGRSAWKPAFVRSLQTLVPAIEAEDLVRSDAGVRAQALAPDGSLVDDFLIVDDGPAVHVLNAPSPAATSALEIAKVVADRVTARLTP